MRKRNLVYSTESGSNCPRCGKPLRKCRCDNGQTARGPSDGIVRLHREARKGSGVTRIEGLTGDSASLKALAKQLKAAIGVGGAVKNGTIELQTADRERLKALLESEGYRVKIAGG